MSRPQFDAWERGEIPPVEHVRPGLWSIPLPLPTASLRYVTVYALEVDQGVALIDAGWDTEEAWDALAKGLARAGGSVKDVRGVLVTHVHPDHYGLAGRIRDISGAWIALHPLDAALIEGRYANFQLLLEDVKDHLVEWGAPVTLLDKLSRASLPAATNVHAATPDVLLEDGDRADLDGRHVQAIWTPGHSPGHLCFYEPGQRLLFTGDHVLPRITPNVSVHPQQRPDPLSDYLMSLGKLGALNTQCVLPAHEYRFRSLHHRIGQLLEHHADRLDSIEDILAEREGAATWDVTRELIRDTEALPAYMLRAAIGETLSHLKLLVVQGRARPEGERPIVWHRTQASSPR